MGGDVEREDRFVGALLGGAVGDALGSFCEGWPRSRIMEVEELLGHYRDLRRAGGAVVRPGGAYTDDTQQALVLVESLLACGRVDPGDVADRLLRMWNAGELYGYGRAFRETLERMARGVPWQQAASTDLPSNGTVMKIAPVGLWHWRSEAQLDADAVALSRLTHKDPRAVAPAVAIAQVVRHLAAGGAPAAADLVALGGTFGRRGARRHRPSDRASAPAAGVTPRRRLRRAPGDVGEAVSGPAGRGCPARRRSPPW